MYPRLFEIPEIFGVGPLTIYTYGVMLAAAYLAGLQLAIGALNVALLAPVWMQLVHLLVADALWIACVLLSARVLGRDRRVSA